MVGHTAAERVVLGPVFGGSAGALLGFIRAPARLFALAAGGSRADFDREPSARRSSWSAASLIAFR